MSDKELNTGTIVKGRLVSHGIFKPVNMGDEDDPNMKYRAVIVFDDDKQGKKAVKAVEKILANAVENQWGNKSPKKLNIWGVQEGDDEEYEPSFEKNFIHPKRGATTKQGEDNPPSVVVKRNGKTVKVSQEDGIIYVGCYVYVKVSAFSGTPKRGDPYATLSLDGIMFAQNGARIGNSFDADKEFEDFDSEESMEDFDDSEFD